MKLTLQEKLLISALRRNNRQMLRESNESTKKNKKFKKLVKIAAMIGVPVAAVATYVAFAGIPESMKEFGTDVYNKIEGFFRGGEQFTDSAAIDPSTSVGDFKSKGQLDRFIAQTDKPTSGGMKIPQTNGARVLDPTKISLYHMKQELKDADKYANITNKLANLNR